MPLGRRKYYRRGRYVVEFVAGILAAVWDVVRAVVGGICSLFHRPVSIDRMGAHNPSLVDAEQAAAVKALVKLGFGRRDAECRVSASTAGSDTATDASQIVNAVLRQRAERRTCPVDV